MKPFSCTEKQVFHTHLGHLSLTGAFTQGSVFASHTQGRHPVGIELFGQQGVLSMGQEVLQGICDVL